MNVKTTVILLVLLILCLGYVIIFHSGWLGRKAEPEVAEDVSKLLTPKVGKVQRLVLERQGAAKIVLVRREDKWRLAEPVDAPATGWQADSTVSTVTALRYARKYALSHPEFPKDDLTHLSAPLRKVTFADDKGATYTLKVGRNVLLSKQTYVQLEGDENVYVVATDLVESLNKATKDYRESDVAEFDTDKAVRVELAGEESFRLIKVDDSWSIDHPVSARAEAEKVKSLLGDISKISAEEFVNDAPTAEDLAGYGLGEPRLVVAVELAPPEPTSQPSTAPTQPAPPKKGRIISIAFGKVADKKVFAKLTDQPWVFRVGESKFKDLQPKLGELRDKAVLEIGEKEATRIEVTLSAGGSTTLEKVEGAWKMRSPFAGDCQDDAVEELLTTLKDLKASEFVDRPGTMAGFGLSPPVGSIVLHFRGSDKTTSLLLGRSSESGQTGFVRDAAGESVAVVAAGDYSKLLRPAPAYWSKSLFQLPEEATVVRVDLDRPDGKFTVESDDGKHKLTRPVTAEADEDNVSALLEAVKTVRAEKVVALNKTLPARFAKLKPIRLTLRYRKPAPAAEPSTAPSTQPGEGATTQPASAPATQPTTQPATQPATQPRFAEHQAEPLLVVKDRGKSYVWREGVQPIAVGELEVEFHQKLSAELRDRTILKLDPDKAASFKMDLEKVSLEFVRSGEQWRYTADRYVKVDAEKVKKFLSDLAGIKPERFVDYGAKPDLSRFGLDKPVMILAVTTDSGESVKLSISRTGPVGTKGHYATTSQVPGVFVLSPEQPKKVQKTLADFRKD